MKKLGNSLIVIGFIAASYFAVLDAELVSAAPFLATLGVAAIGVALVRFAVRQAGLHEDHLMASIETLRNSLERIAASAATLDEEKADVDVYELRNVIDERFPADIDSFVQARESIAHSFGLQGYAEVMNSFAAAERNLNRVWSASTDGYIDEAHTYLGKASRQFAAALEVFRGLESQA